MSKLNGIPQSELVLPPTQKSISELQETIRVVNEIVSNFAAVFPRLSQLDIGSLGQEIVATMVQKCYLVVKETMKGEPEFDKERMDSKIKDALKEVQQAIGDLALLKGQFLAVNEAAINKDPLLLKLDKMIKIKEKQEQIIKRLPQLETDIEHSITTSAEVKKLYQKFEVKIFTQLMNQIRKIAEDSNAAIDKIIQQQEDLRQKVAKARTSLNEVAPSKSDHRQKLQKVHNDVDRAEAVIDKSFRRLEMSLKQKELCDKRKAECEEIFVGVGEKELDGMLPQSKQLVLFVANAISWRDLFESLRGMEQQEIGQVEYELTRAVAEVKKILDTIRNDQSQEMDDLLKQIKKLAEVIQVESDDQQQRLEGLKAKLTKPDGTPTAAIPLSDQLLIDQEIQRNQAAIQALKAVIDQVLADSMDLKNEEGDISADDIIDLRQKLKSLLKIEQNELPRVKRNIDQLEASQYKAMKSQLNEDNYKSQMEITRMKKNYEDLQKKIDSLNQKIVRINEEARHMNEEFINEDLERDNEIFKRITSALTDCDRDVNGEKEEEGQSESLQEKRRVIIGDINKMVKQFNEYNKLIKDQNKTHNVDISLLIQTSKEIQDDCKEIESKIQLAVVFADEIDERLNSILNPALPEIKKKYLEKNHMIDECDESFDRINQQIEKDENDLSENLKKVEDIIHKLEDAIPIVGKGDEERRQKLLDMIEKSKRQREELEKQKEDLLNLKDYVISMVEPLNELGEREVKIQDINDILAELKKSDKKIEEFEADLESFGQSLDEIDKFAADIISKEKERKIAQVQQAIDQIDASLESLSDQRKKAVSKLEQLQQLIEEAKAVVDPDDPEMVSRLKEMERQAHDLEKEIEEIDLKMDDLRKKRNEKKRRLSDLIRNVADPKSVQAIDDMMKELEGDKETALDLIKEVDEKMGQTENEMEKVRLLIEQNRDKKAVNGQISQIRDTIDHDFTQMRKIVQLNPMEIEDILVVLQEMRRGAVNEKDEEDLNGDYVEHKEDIDRNLQKAALLQQNFQAHNKDFKRIGDAYEEIISALGKNPEKQVLKKLLADLGDLQKEVDKVLNEACDSQEEVGKLRNKLDDCMIPVTIQFRKAQLDQFSERLEIVKEDFRDLKQTDQEYEGSVDTEQRITHHVKEIEKALKGFEQERKDHAKFYSATLERFDSRDFHNLKTAPKIMREIREYQTRLRDSDDRLTEMKKTMDKLNNELIKQDIVNATNLLTKKAEKMRERLSGAKEKLKQIDECGQKMDGNTSHLDEEEFIDALKDEMPMVFNKITTNFKQIDKIEKLIDQVRTTKDIAQLDVLKKEVIDASNKVEQSESLSLKLEKEIIEWNGLGKLCRRDVELEEIQALLEEFEINLKDELVEMDKELKKKQEMIDSQGDPIGEIAHLIEGIRNYVLEIKELIKGIDGLKDKRQGVFDLFDQELPFLVKEERYKRALDQGVTGKRGHSPNKRIQALDQDEKKRCPPPDTYKILETNCKYKRQVQDLLKELREVNKLRRDLDHRYSALKRDLKHLKPVKAYKPVKGDEVDELFAQYINKNMLSIPVKRIEGGKYMFGTRQIMARIINGKLVIRVGGGFMSAEEFIEQYGKIEMLKLMKNNQRDAGSLGRNSSGNDSSRKMDSSVVGIGDIKDMMKAQIANVKIYEDHSQNIYGTFDQNASRMSMSPAKSRPPVLDEGIVPRSQGPQMSPSPAKKSIQRSPLSQRKSSYTGLQK